MRFASEPVSFPLSDNMLLAVPPGAGVFAVWTNSDRPYIGRTSDLPRRLGRLLRLPTSASRMLNLRSIATRVECWPTASGLESNLVFYEIARAYNPADYLRLLRLRMPAYVRLNLTNAFPRTHVTNRPASEGISYGPFRTRAAAELFERGLLDLFQLRRCHEDLQPSPDHPGCVYGEMNMCLRPCQSIVSIDEYRSEAHRIGEFLNTDARSALASAQASRDRLSSEMEFEEAARQHKRVEAIEEVIRLRDELAHDTDRLCGVSVQPSILPEHVCLWFMVAGVWQSPVQFSVAQTSASMDNRLKEAVASLKTQETAQKERAEHLAILARWYYSSWRDGIWLGSESLDRMSWRRLVSAVSKTAQQSAVHQSQPAASVSFDGGLGGKLPGGKL